MRREQVVGAVVYGQFVPEESTHPPAGAPTPVTDAAAVPSPADDGVFASGDGVPTSADGVPASGDGVPASVDGGVPVNADGVAVDAEGNPVDDGKFLVRLDNFTGPFDLLLQLIGKHKLDVTEIALHQVTDDFIAYIRAMGDDWDLGETSEFLLVAATLLDLKAARLLPAADVEDEEDLALLEARDLLFARLLQYKAYKEAASHIMELEINGMRRWPRAVSMEPRYAEALPELVLGIGPERLFKLALKQFAPKPGPPEVSIAHIHQVRVSVREHATLLRDRLRRAGQATFTLLVADCENTLEVVARFLALLELYREGLIDFEQPVSLDELTVRWIGGDTADADLDIDDYEGTKPDPNADTTPTDPDGDADPADLDAEADPNVDWADLDADPDADLDPASAEAAWDVDAVDDGRGSSVRGWNADETGDPDDSAGNTDTPVPAAAFTGAARDMAVSASALAVASADAIADTDAVADTDASAEAILDFGASSFGSADAGPDGEPSVPLGAASASDAAAGGEGGPGAGDQGGELPGPGIAGVDDRLDAGGVRDDFGEEDDDAEERS